MKKFNFSIILFSLSFFCSAQSNHGSRITAMGDAGLALQDVWSTQKNQAGIAALKNPMIAVGYESRFNIKELSVQSAVVAIPLKKISLGASFQSYGVDAYREIKTGLSLAKAFGPKLLIALSVNHHQLKINNYGNAHSFSVEAGLQYELSPHLWLATHVANPNQSNYGDQQDQTIPAHIQFGGSYVFSDQLLICAEIEKVLDAQIDFKTGLEYKIIDLLALRGGVSANPFKQYAGFGLRYGNLDLDFAIASHPVLGLSPQISLGYEF